MPHLVAAHRVRSPIRTGPELPTEPFVVRRTRRAGQGLARAYAELDAAVLAMRAEGATWGDVGAVLEMTRQAAHRRFAHLR